MFIVVRGFDDMLYFYCNSWYRPALLTKTMMMTTMTRHREVQTNFISSQKFTMSVSFVMNTMTMMHSLAIIILSCVPYYYAIFLAMIQKQRHDKSCFRFASVCVRISSITLCCCLFFPIRELPYRYRRNNFVDAIISSSILSLNRGRRIAATSVDIAITAAS